VLVILYLYNPLLQLAWHGHQMGPQRCYRYTRWVTGTLSQTIPGIS